MATAFVPLPGLSVPTSTRSFRAPVVGRPSNRAGAAAQPATRRSAWITATAAPVSATSVTSTASTPATAALRQEELLNESSPPFLGRTGILLVNTGTPSSTSVSDVRAYLRQFLGDHRVLDINPIIRWLVLNFVILPFRPKESAQAYATIWDENRGSPLLFHSQDLAEKLQERVGENFDVDVGMLYGEPSVFAVMENFRARGVDRLVVVPMYPQYASSSTGAAIEIVYKAAAKVYSTPYLHLVPAFYDHPAYIRSYADIIRRIVGDQCTNFDHLLLSFHGVPEQHCSNTDETGLYCQKQENCCSAIVQANRNCYRAQSFATARRIVSELNIPEGKYSIAFQSRLSAAGPEWIKPYTDKEIVNLAKAGYKNIACVVPSFTADCLETLEEIAVRGQEEFQEAGGESLTLIPCLNSEDAWADSLVEIIKDSCPMETF